MYLPKPISPQPYYDMLRECRKRIHKLENYTDEERTLDKRRNEKIMKLKVIHEFVSEMIDIICLEKYEKHLYYENMRHGNDENV